MSRMRPLGIAVMVVACLVGLCSPAAQATIAPPPPIDWPTFGFDLARSGFNPNETQLTPATVPNLRLRWSTELDGGVMIGQPVVAAGVPVDGVRRTVVYEGTEHGELAALDAATGEVLWHQELGSVETACNDTPDGVFGIGGGAAIDRARGWLYVAGGDGAVHAFGLANGVERAHWPVEGVFDPTEIHDYGGLTYDPGTGKLYVTFAGHCDINPYHGKITSIDVATHEVRKEFYPSGPVVNGGGIWGPGGVSIDLATHHVFTATGNARRHPETYRYSEAMVELSSSLTPLGSDQPPLEGNDVDFGATPLLFDPPGCPGFAAVMNKTGSLFLYERGGVDDGAVQRLQISREGSGHFQGIPAWSPRTGDVYLTDDGDSPDGVYRHGLIALHVGTGCRLRLAWQRTFGSGGFAYPAPTVAGDVVYAADGAGDEVRAWVSSSGRLLWSSGIQVEGAAFVAPTVVDGMVLVPSWDGRLACFSL